MNILWFCNAPTSEARTLFGLPSNPFGGWLEGLSVALAEAEDVRLTIAFCGVSLGRPVFKTGERIEYVMYHPEGALRESIADILSRVKPDVIHIHGFEFSQHNEIADYIDLSRTVISIQGLKSFYSDHFLLGVEPRSCHSFPITYMGIRRGSLARQKRRFLKSGKSERALLGKAKHIIGRTTWDKACTAVAAPLAEYYVNRETMRSPFYEGKWDPAQMRRHSIFLSQAGYAIKGAHYLLRAASLLRDKYPDLHIEIAGGNMIGGRSLREKMKVSAYGAYLKKLIKRYSLSGAVTFSGVLSAEQMKEAFLRSNVFVLPSTIENSPNSLGEAMLLGVPCVASCVGGVQDMLLDREEGYIYPVNDTVLLAHYIDLVFSDDETAKEMGRRASAHARISHNAKTNVGELLDIYQKIAQCNN